MKKTEKELLQDQFYTIRDKLAKIEIAEFSAQNKPMIGKCFKYTSGYGKGNWILYSKVISVEDQFFKVFSFQVTSYGKVEVKFETIFNPTLGQPCTLKEMRTAWRKAIKRFTKKGDSVLGNKP